MKKMYLLTVFILFVALTIQGCGMVNSNLNSSNTTTSSVPVVSKTSNVKSNEITKQSVQTNPLFDTSLVLPNGQVVTPDQLEGQTVINHSVRWKDLLISLQISSPGGWVIGNHSTVLSHSSVSTSAGTATLVLNERTPPAAAESTTPTYEYWVISNRSQYTYAIEATVIGNLDKAKNEVMELLNSWKVPQ